MSTTSPTNENESVREPRLSAICVRCGVPTEAGELCTNCGYIAQFSSDSEFTISVSMSIIDCDACGATMSCGVLKCPSCEATIDFIDPDEAPLNKSKLKALGHLLPEFEKLANPTHKPMTPTPVISDHHLIEYITRNNLFSPDLINDCRTVSDGLDLSSSDAIRSRQNTRAFEEFLDRMRNVRDVYTDLDEMKLPSRYDDLHLYLLVVYDAILDIYVWTAKAILATTIEAAHLAQSRVQSALDRAGDAAQLVSHELDEQGLDAQGSTLNDRLAAFNGVVGNYEHRGRVDLAAVIGRNVNTLNSMETAQSFTSIGKGYFGSRLPLSATVLPLEDALALFVLAAEISSSTDPLTLRRRTLTCLELYEDALQTDRQYFLTYIADSEQDISEALVMILSLRDKLLNLDFDRLSIEAIRLELIQTHGTLTEWIYGRLINLVLGAKFILKGRPETYLAISHRGFGDKVHILDQDLKGISKRHTFALRGISTVARNAAAHGGVTISGNQIQLRQRDRNGIEVTEEISDEAFYARLLDLLMTCQSMYLSLGLLRIAHQEQFATPSAEFPTRLLSEAAEGLVGLWQLEQAEVQRDSSGSCVTVTTFSQEEHLRNVPEEYLPCAFMLASLFQAWTHVCLIVADSTGERYKIAMPTLEAASYATLPINAKLFGVLKVQYSTLIHPTKLTATERYHKIWIKGVAILLMKEVGALAPLRQQLPATSDQYIEALHQQLTLLNVLRGLHRSVDAPADCSSISHSLSKGIQLLRKGLKAHRESLRRGRWTEAQNASPILDEAVDVIISLSQ